MTAPRLRGSPAHNTGNHLIAEYAYNSEGERIKKTNHTQTPAKTTHYLYENKQLIAELDAKGEVIKQYLYLSGRPFAMLQDGTLYAIHTDWRHAPVSITGPDGNIVWQADYSPFGQAEVESDPDGNGEHLQFNLRLPGQYHDVETGTAYNLYRDYDPQSGRYLTSDPLGAVAGLNTYAYVDNDPLNRIDPLGLYGKEIHYYMTYFLAVTAGVPKETALVIALADQYIDENPLTIPIWPTALAAYHFTQPRETTPGDPLTSFKDPRSPQLTNLYNAAMLFDRACPVNRQPPGMIKAQLYGEYLHAYADTYSHRDEDNNPYGVWSSGYGHAVDGTLPDRTYNFVHTYHDIGLDEEVNIDWLYQEVRTLEAEKQIFYQLREDFRVEIEAQRAKPFTTEEYQAESDDLWKKLAGDGNADIGVAGRPGYEVAKGTTGVVQKFNKEKDKKEKRKILNDWLTQQGPSLPIPYVVDENSNEKPIQAHEDVKSQGSTNRNTYLEGFEPGDLEGVLLPPPSTPVFEIP
ncbi:MAG: hypothetical protein KZQ85_13360 [Candidatus Thiodiazotropha sp. (ex Myrtea sp. 'scaly one' KF741663)]|nr:hypothetical protein [Candidatus Thiodiazotropha sp. (ex Myrtea sp. 'scaly one' KF741663)]